MVWSKATVRGRPSGICVPETLIKTWAHHDQHGAEFRVWLDRFAEEFPEQDVTMDGKNDNKGEGPTPKRGAGVVPGFVTPPSKKAKIDEKHMIKAEEVPGEMHSVLGTKSECLFLFHQCFDPVCFAMLLLLLAFVFVIA